MTERAPYLVLGAGVAGLATGWELGDRAIVVERELRPGGLVRTERRGDFWFDHVLHLLYFADPHTDARIRGLLGSELAPLEPEAWVESRSGVARFPLQMHLATLPPEVITACLHDLAGCQLAARGAPPASFEEHLLASFGRAMCEEFLFPYNRKVWKRELAQLAPTGFQWNITPPDFAEVVRGAISKRIFRPYNASGFYPRPPSGAPVRGMELLAQRLAGKVPDLRLGHSVVAIDLDERVVVVESERGETQLVYERGIIATLPLPRVVELCVQAPDALRARTRELTRNRVTSVALAFTGPRPTGRGHWRYYADESLCFTRLVHLHEFDPESAPPHGFGILAELTERGETARDADEIVIRRVVDDVMRADAVLPGSEVIDAAVTIADPAYVVFDHASQAVVAEARSFLAGHDVHLLGRYGRWEYSSMAQVMRDGFALAGELRA